VGVTIYWVVRDDHLASSVRIIGNQEWESWFILDDLMNPIGGKPLEVSSGDTHGQHLAAWGLADLLGKRITVRFRQLGQVKIYGPKPGKWCGLTRVSEVNWALLRKASNSLHRVAAAIKSGAIAPSEILRIWNLYDESGVNIAEALRELGKVIRTEFILTYASDPHLREEIQQGCQRAENWNSFQEAVFFGKGGRIETNNPHRRDEIGLAMALILDSILFYNAWKWGARLKKGTSLTPAIWSHVKLLGRYRFRREPAS
jgi:TnpA family transposase